MSTLQNILNEISKIKQSNIVIDDDKLNKINNNYQQKKSNQGSELNLELISSILAYDITDYKLQKIAGMILYYQNEKNATEQQVSIDDIYAKYQMNENFSQKFIQWREKYNELSVRLKHRNYAYDYFAMKTYTNSYMLSVQKNNILVYETPIQLFFRVSLQLSENEEDFVKNSISMCNGLFIHASPTLFNSGLAFPQLSSCFLMQIQEDSISGIYDSLKESAIISKYGGGLSIAISSIRSKNSIIKSTNGQSQGICSMLKVFNETCRYVNQSSRRKGSFAIYLEPWHPDVMEYLQLRKNTGQEQDKCRDLFFALFINDLFMQRVQDDQIWSFFDPNVVNLQEYYGTEFQNKYLQAEQDKKYTHQMKARDLMEEICKTQIETSQPYIVYKDQVNKACNQNNLGTIKQSNLCVEITLYTDDKQTAVCNLCSINLKKFIKKNLNIKEFVCDEFNVHMLFDLQKLQCAIKQIVQNLDNVIDHNYYPSEKCRYSNIQNRPIGIGVQGLQNVFFKLKMPFESQQAQIVNKFLFEAIYYYSLQCSMQLAQQKGQYSTFQGSQFSKGILQYDNYNNMNPVSKYFDWKQLKNDIIQYGTRHSMLTCVQPTQTVSQLMNNYESIEPQMSNIYTRRTLSGEFILVNKYLLRDLVKMGYGQQEINSFCDQLILNQGNLQNMDLPQHIKDLYKTVWQIKQKDLINMSSDRQLYIDQSQSLNIFVQNPNTQIMRSIHLYSWQKQLKSGMYYLRQQNISNATQFVNFKKSNEPKICKVCQ